MKKLFGISVVAMLATVATSHAVASGGWTCNTTCTDTRGFEYVRVSYGSGPDQAYQNLSCQGSDTVSGDINCWNN
ncbi:MAG: hypothetical protein QOF89_6044 [Acidobacteriota bacterium]|nr:hypothetical protein [Acidobacteriota bacterium]